MSKSTQDASPSGRFGTFGGVFTPCTLTILGVIMFLRFGFVVGEAGVIYALAIVSAAKLITFLTSLSLSAIATNTRVQGGGAYFLISRSLGIEFGGAIGLIFFLAQSISVAMYVVGFSEAYLAEMPAFGLSLTGVATIVNALVFACVLVGAGWTIKLQYLIFGLLIASLASFYVGAASAFDLDDPARQPPAPFWPGTKHLYDVCPFLSGRDRNHGRRQHVGRPEGSEPIDPARHPGGRRLHDGNLFEPGRAAGSDQARGDTRRRQPCHGVDRPLASPDHRGRFRGDPVVGAGQHDGSPAHPAGIRPR